MHHRTIRVLLALGLALLIAGCSSTATETESETIAEPREKSAVAALEEILTADTKTGTYDATTVFASGESTHQTAEFWIDEGLFRIDYFLEDGTRRISILTEDGLTAYFAFDDAQSAEPAVASVKHYLDMFSLPEGDLEDLGIDKETGAQMLRYVIQRTDEVEGSTNAWYSEDATYYVKDGELLRLEQRGAAPEEDGTIPKLQTSTMEFTSFRIGEPVDSTVFTIPYPIQTTE